jgi:hypothetical protein
VDSTLPIKKHSSFKLRMGGGGEMTTDDAGGHSGATGDAAGSPIKDKKEAVH